MRLLLNHAAAQVTRLRLQREATRQEARVRAELARYASARDRAELDAILGRHTAAEIAELERLLPLPPAA